MSKNILLISNRLDFGGAEIYVVSIANRLIDLGYTVNVASSGGKLVKELSPGIKHHTISADAKGIIKIMSCSIQLNQILRDNAIEIIHSNSVITCLIARLAGKKLSIPVINDYGWWKVYAFRCPLLLFSLSVR